MDIRASKEELKQAHVDFSDDIVELPDGDYPAVLAVYHELHCLVCDWHRCRVSTRHKIKANRDAM